MGVPKVLIWNSHILYPIIVTPYLGGGAEVVINENHEKLSDPHTTRHGDSLAYLGQ